ncbi:hypothetical protein [Alteromonas sp. H39]|uniref:hypothetical protein n=1 Tax=Alteromonas sp. H39 TaxID=3389876 RepID=UPI0039DFD520
MKPFFVFIMASALIMITLSVQACASSPPAPESLTFTAEVQINKTNKKSFVLVSLDGKQYEPINLPTAFRVAGTVIKVNATRVTDRATSEQSGVLVRIDSAELVSEGDGLSDNTYY